MAVSSEYRVNIVISSKDQTTPAAKTATKSLDALAVTAKVAAAGFAVLKTAQAAVKFMEFGAGVQRARSPVRTGFTERGGSVVGGGERSDQRRPVALHADRHRRECDQKHQDACGDDVIDGEHRFALIFCFIHSTRGRAEWFKRPGGRRRHG